MMCDTKPELTLQDLVSEWATLNAMLVEQQSKIDSLEARVAELADGVEWKDSVD